MDPRRLSKYKPIGVSLSGTIPSSPSMQSILNLKLPSHQDSNNNNDNDVQHHVMTDDELNALFTRHERLQSEIHNKLHKWESISRNLDQLVSFADVESRQSTVHQQEMNNNDVEKFRNELNGLQKGYNPLPTPDNDDDDDYDGLKYQRQFHNENNLYDIPSSPESFGSNTSQLEIELNNKISNLTHLRNNDKNIIKLKNIVNNSLELMNFRIDDNKLMNYNDEVYQKSQIFKSKLTSLIDSFTPPS